MHTVCFRRTWPALVGLLTLQPLAMADTAGQVAVAVPAVANSSPGADAQALAARISELALQHGANDHALAEHHITLARALQETADHAGASEHLSRALYLERMHKGLNHAGQIPVLELLVDSNRALGDWDAVAANLKLLGWINQQHAGEHTDAWRNTQHRLVLGHLESSHHPGKTSGYTHVVTALELTAQALAGLGPGAERDRWLRLKAGLSYQAAQLIGARLAGTIPRSRVQRGRGRMEPLIDDYLRFQNLMARHLHQGLKALEEAQQHATNSDDPVRVATAAVHLADWMQLTGKSRQARELYAEAQRNAHSAGLDWFDSHRRLPAFLSELPVARVASAEGETNATTATESSPAPSRFVRTRFDVDVNGRARNIEIVETQPPRAHRMARQVREQLKRTRFRPRFEGNQPVVSNDIEIRFVMPGTGKKL